MQGKTSAKGKVKVGTKSQFDLWNERKININGKTVGEALIVEMGIKIFLNFQCIQNA